MVWISDTAGLRETDDIVEAEGVRRARQAAAEADVRIWLFDARDGIEDDLVQPGDIVVVNKSDLVSPDVSRETLLISAKDGKGIDRVEASIVDRLSGLTNNLSAPMITRARHRQGIEGAKTHLNAALDHLKMGMGSEFTAEEVRLARRELGSLPGHVETEMVLGAVFSSFCIGK